MISVDYSAYTGIIGDITEYWGVEMLEPVFGSRAVEEALLFMLIHDSCYATQLSKHFDTALSSFQQALDRLERGNIIVSKLQGKTRVYLFNPRYPFLKELKQFLAKAYTFLPEETRSHQYEPITRTRPRKRGKPL